MIRRVQSVLPLSDYCLEVLFDDGRRVLYDMKEDMTLPGYEVLERVKGLFAQVRLDESRTCVYWNHEIDLPSDILYDYGKPC